MDFFPLAEIRAAFDKINEGRLLAQKSGAEMNKITEDDRQATREFVQRLQLLEDISDLIALRLAFGDDATLDELAEGQALILPQARRRYLKLAEEIFQRIQKEQQ